MSEKTQISDKIIDYCKERPDWFMRKIHCSSFQGKGLPDLWGCYRGMMVVCEAKLPKGITSKMQEHYIYLLRRAGASAFVAYSLDDFISKAEADYDRWIKTREEHE